MMGWLGGCIKPQQTIYLQQNHPNGQLPDIKEIKEYDFQYRLRANDIISVKISSISPSDYNFFTASEKEINEKDPLLTGFLIHENGAIELPYVGNVEIVGLTLLEAKQKLKEVAGQYLESPTVNIRLLSFHFTVLGEVGRQGRYTTYNPKTTVLEAIGMAGGLNDFAERSKIKIIRSEYDNTKIFYVNVLDDQLASSEFYYLQPNDVIAVSALKTKDFRHNHAPNLALAFSAISAISLIFLNLTRVF
jgi:polysaccharide export outer membrane protein